MQTQQIIDVYSSPRLGMIFGAAVGENNLTSHLGGFPKLIRRIQQTKSVVLSVIRSHRKLETFLLYATTQIPCSKACKISVLVAKQYFLRFSSSCAFGQLSNSNSRNSGRHGLEQEFGILLSKISDPISLKKNLI